MVAGRIQVRVPKDLWDASEIEEAVIANWLCNDNDHIEYGATVAEVAAEKSTYDITAPATGTITIEIAKDGIVQLGTVIAYIRAD